MKVLNVDRTPGFFANGTPLREFNEAQLKSLVHQEVKKLNALLGWPCHPPRLLARLWRFKARAVRGWTPAWCPGWTKASNSRYRPLASGALARR